MTVAVVCNVAEGVVLGVDSAVSLTVGDGSDARVVKVFEGGDKLFGVSGRPIGIAIYGMGSIGPRPVSSYIHEFQVREAGTSIRKGQVPLIVEGLRGFVAEAYKSIVIPKVEKETGEKFEALPDEKKPGLGVLVGGFSVGSYLAEVWHIKLPEHVAAGSAEIVFNQGTFDAKWFATFGPIERYIWGNDPGTYGPMVAFVEGLVGRQLTDEERGQLVRVLVSQRYIIPYGLMPLKDAIMHVGYLVELVINHYKFALEDAVVGGQGRVGFVSYKSTEFRELDLEE